MEICDVIWEGGTDHSCARSVLNRILGKELPASVPIMDSALCFSIVVTWVAERPEAAPDFLDLAHA